MALSECLFMQVLKVSNANRAVEAPVCPTLNDTHISQLFGQLFGVLLVLLFSSERSFRNILVKVHQCWFVHGNDRRQTGANSIFSR